MTSPNGGPFMTARDTSQVGAQGQDVIIEGDVKMTASADEPPEAKYTAGVMNLVSVTRSRLALISGT
jgi:hypothetical protein